MIESPPKSNFILPQRTLFGEDPLFNYSIIQLFNYSVIQLLSYSVHSLQLKPILNHPVGTPSHKHFKFPGLCPPTIVGAGK